MTKEITINAPEGTKIEGLQIEQIISQPADLEVGPVKVGDAHLPVPAAPLLGEHVDSVLSEWLDMSPEEVEKLKNSGAV